MSVSLTQEKMMKFFLKFKKEMFKKGETLVSPSNQQEHVYFLHKGYVRQYTVSEDGQELTLTIFKPDSYIFLLLPVNSPPNRYYYEAMTPVEVWKAPKSKVIEFVQQDPQLLQDMLIRISSALNGMLSKVESLVFGNAQKKVSAVLLISAKRFGIPKDHAMQIQLPLTHKDIASQIGLTRETVSIEMAKLKKLKIISNRGKFIIIHNLKALEEKAFLSELS